MEDNMDTNNSFFYKPITSMSLREKIILAEPAVSNARKAICNLRTEFVKNGCIEELKHLDDVLAGMNHTLYVQHIYSQLFDSYVVLLEEINLKNHLISTFQAQTYMLERQVEFGKDE
jgi:hypothetical protein